MNRKAPTLQVSMAWELPLRHNYVKLPGRSSAMARGNKDIIGTAYKRVLAKKGNSHLSEASDGLRTLYGRMRPFHCKPIEKIYCPKTVGTKRNIKGNI